MLTNLSFILTSDQMKLLQNLGILISGRGSNMEAILKAIKKQRIPINPAIVISNKPNANGLKIAQRLGVKTLVIESKNYKSTRTQYDKKIISALEQNGVTAKNGLVCLAGFMRIISPYFIRKYKNRILNIHPALLPAYPGLDAQKQAIQNGAKVSGCTVHFIDEGVDSGPIILQAVVKVKNNDTEKTLSERILKKEHVIYAEAIRLLARKKIRLSGRRVRILN
jgi:phosphoribosylglycinamide formyltransferase-1